MEVVDKLSELGSRVEPALERYLLKDTDVEFHEAVLYQMKTGGKRLRPALTFASSLAAGGDVDSAIPAAAAVELAHNYSLIFDDIIDHSELRRGRPTLWKKYGVTMAILVAVHYRESIAQALDDTKDPVAFHDIMARTLKLLVEGERLDVLFEQAGREDEPYVKEKRKSNVKLSDYIDMVFKKTGALIETACVFGAMSAGASSQIVNMLGGYGRNLGLAFQIGDDIIDIFGREEVTGKRVGKDIEEHKLGNVIVILALEELELNKQNELTSILRKDSIKASELKKAIELITYTKAKERAEALRSRYAHEAMKSIEKLPNTEGKALLKALADFVATREF
ncbi:MAG: polyprenyl synthetase family protein [Thermofilaceae archaeon]